MFKGKRTTDEQTREWKMTRKIEEDSNETSIIEKNIFCDLKFNEFFKQ